MAEGLRKSESVESDPLSLSEDDEFSSTRQPQSPHRRRHHHHHHQDNHQQHQQHQHGGGREGGGGSSSDDFSDYDDLGAIAAVESLPSTPGGTGGSLTPSRGKKHEISWEDITAAEDYPEKRLTRSDSLPDRGSNGVCVSPAWSDVASSVEDGSSDGEQPDWVQLRASISTAVTRSPPVPRLASPFSDNDDEFSWDSPVRLFASHLLPLHPRC